jgi:hypothetical protein
MNRSKLKTWIGDICWLLKLEIWTNQLWQGMSGFLLQIFNANLSLLYPQGDPQGWVVFKPTMMRTIKFARLAIIVRLLYHVLPHLYSISAARIVIRGCRLYAQKYCFFGHLQSEWWLHHVTVAKDS